LGELFLKPQECEIRTPQSISCASPSSTLRERILGSIASSDQDIYADIPLDDIHGTDDVGLNIGHVAAKYGHRDVLTAWLDAGGDIMSRYSMTGATIGHIAAHNGEHDILRAWMERGGAVDARTHRGRSIGHEAAWDGARSCLLAWLDAGGDVNAKDNQGFTIIHAISETSRCRSMVAMHAAFMASWVERGGDIHACDAEGLSIGAALHRRYPSLADAWIHIGGVWMDGTPSRRFMTHIMHRVAEPHDHALILNHASMRLHGHPAPEHPRDMIINAARTPVGERCAHHTMHRIQDPMMLAAWIQTISP
jgi:hypothetical protein